MVKHIKYFLLNYDFISTAGLGFRFGLGTWIPNPMATYYYAGHVSTDSDSDSNPLPKWVLYQFKGQIFVPVTYISIRGSELMGKSCIVQESLSESESESESGNGNKPLLLRLHGLCHEETRQCIALNQFHSM